MSIDIAVNLFMQTIQNPFLVAVSKFFDLVFDAVILILISLIISVYLFLKKKRTEAYVFFISMVIIGGFVELLKEIFMRSRPLNSVISATGYAFPSGHAAAAIVFFGLLAYIFFRNKSLRIKRTAYFFAAVLILLIGLSRIYLRVHWLSDVLGGFLVGGIVLIFGIIILQRKKF